ncbi:MULTISPECIES: MFS transporter [Okeania]|uniref:MFS transporter n=1 Tax=Okeania hirsuta TaxID=1458930 RepID=A0A3N6R9F7_9CYAN|nr:MULTISPECIES: MFS transporter [Okeania]NET13602.1 MFS transporter [Okeania sp. SIO1H6]NEP70700.1 MFS transporter [Okeania sp. SIO2G5]NEP93398.1 MFS transporter [Okeania sp. SIO2F5]NEQ89807.1 MFS transporter [Okeania sp. SIO2G4]NES76009.1 MFS transporter [Okeania sp. SIO1H4]
MENSKFLSHSTKIYLDRNLQIIIGITLIAVLGSAGSIGPVLPTMASALQIPPEKIGLVITAFVVPIAIGTPILGVLADRFGRKQILIPSLLLFAIAGVACSFAPNFRTLLELRFLQGVGAASLEFLALTLISDLYAGKSLTSAMAFNASMIGISLTVYPLITGWLATWGWRYPFLLPLLAVPVVLAVIFFLELPSFKKTPKFRLRVYLRNIWHSVNNRQVLGLLFAVVALFILLFGAYFTYIPILAADIFAGSNVAIGIILATMALSLAFVSSQVALFSQSISEFTLIKISFVLYTLAVIVTPFLQSMWLLLIPSILFGAAHGMCYPATQALLGKLAPPDYRAGFMAVNATVLSTGQALGPLLAGVAFGIWGMAGVFYAAAGFSVLSLGLISKLFVTIE